MRAKRAKALNEQARLAARDGSVIKSEEYKKLKKLHTNPHYSKNTNSNSGGTRAFTGKARLARKKLQEEAK